MRTANRFRARERAQLSAAGPCDRERLERKQRRAQGGFLPLGTLGNQTDASVASGENLHDDAGILIRVSVQDECLFVFKAALDCVHRVGAV